MNIKKKRVTTLYVLVLSISILSCGVHNRKKIAGEVALSFLSFRKAH